MEVRPTRAEVDLGAIAHNVQTLKAAVGDKVELYAVVKADAYGHGALPVALRALESGATRLAVAFVEEGVALRQAGITAPILVMGWTPPRQLPLAVAHDLAQTIFTEEDGRALADAAEAAGRKATAHIKVDTGMGRLGFPVAGGDAAAVAAAIGRVARLPLLDLEGIFTHFSVSEGASEPDRAYTFQQLASFHDLLGRLASQGIAFRLRHAANSGAIWRLPAAHLDAVRAGISLYGYYPEGAPPAGPWPWPLIRPALTWRTRVGLVKEAPAGVSVSYGRAYTTRGLERLATLPVGYADGYNRGLSGRGQVLLGGRRATVAGRVCMDQIVVRLPDGLDAHPGDEVVLLGRQGEEAITADEMGGWLGTISYEILCAIGKRVPRIYLA